MLEFYLLAFTFICFYKTVIVFFSSLSLFIITLLTSDLHKFFHIFRTIFLSLLPKYFTDNVLNFIRNGFSLYHRPIWPFIRLSVVFLLVRSFVRLSVRSGKTAPNLWTCRLLRRCILNPTQQQQHHSQTNDTNHTTIPQYQQHGQQWSTATRP